MTSPEKLRSTWCSISWIRGVDWGEHSAKSARSRWERILEKINRKIAQRAFAFFRLSRQAEGGRYMLCAEAFRCITIGNWVASGLPD
jgi:hypothetical protein